MPKFLTNLANRYSAILKKIKHRGHCIWRNAILVKYLKIKQCNTPFPQGNEKHYVTIMMNVEYI